MSHYTHVVIEAPSLGQKHVVHAAKSLARSHSSEQTLSCRGGV